MFILGHVYELVICNVDEETRMPFANSIETLPTILQTSNCRITVMSLCTGNKRQKLLTVNFNWDTLNKDNDSHQVYDPQQAIRQYETSFQFWSMFKFTGQSNLQVYYNFTHFKTSSSAVKGSLNFVRIQVGCF